MRPFDLEKALAGAKPATLTPRAQIMVMLAAEDFFYSRDVKGVDPRTILLGYRDLADLILRVDAEGDSDAKM